MGLILDIVPNHMGVMGSDNAWWLDVLENGEASIYAGFFDIDWHPLKEEFHGKILLPVLHDHYGAVLESGELKLIFHPRARRIRHLYHDHRFPVDPREYPRILRHCADMLTAKLGEQNPDLLELQSLITAFRTLTGSGKRSAAIASPSAIAIKKSTSAASPNLCARSPEIADGIKRAVDRSMARLPIPASFDELHELIKAQAFRLANWRVASDDINYRRFFDTNDLAGICMENEDVFEATHRLILQSDGRWQSRWLAHRSS